MTIHSFIHYVRNIDHFIWNYNKEMSVSVHYDFINHMDEKLGSQKSTLLFSSRAVLIFQSTSNNLKFHLENRTNVLRLRCGDNSHITGIRKMTFQ